MAIDAPDTVLSTLYEDGRRRWLKPKLSTGRFLQWRRVVAWVLLILYNALPWIQINGRQAIQLNIAAREFSFFGLTLLPTDTMLFMLFMAAVFVSIFLITALFGRLWCGWACPQTVYMEFVFRPLERLFLGTGGRRNTPWLPLRRVAMYVAFAVIAFHLANTFLAYFVGARTVFEWSLGSPLAHPGPFLLVLFVTGLILFDFGFFREQVCILACPYGRFQSVMLDRSSLIISYDEQRGEPRGPRRRNETDDSKGDCVACSLCVQTCPTGIDIRHGLQMECIGCAQCIDACDKVMDTIGLPRGLIRYTSQDALEQKKSSFLRPRIIIYPIILAILLTILLVALIGRAPADVGLTRAGGRTFTTLPSGGIVNDVAVRIVNRTDEPQVYVIAIEGVAASELTVRPDDLTVGPGGTLTATASITAPGDLFVNGRLTCQIVVTSDAGFLIQRSWTLQGPWDAQQAERPNEGDEL